MQMSLLDHFSMAEEIIYDALESHSASEEMNLAFYRLIDCAKTNIQRIEAIENSQGAALDMENIQSTLATYIDCLDRLSLRFFLFSEYYPPIIKKLRMITERVAEIGCSRMTN